MFSYRYMIFVRVSNEWRFANAFMTDEAASKHAARLSLEQGRVKMIERYEDETSAARILRIFYFYKGQYHHKVKTIITA